MELAMIGLGRMGGNMAHRLTDAGHTVVGWTRSGNESLAEQYGIWIILIKGLTPIPYKLVTIASGAAHFDLFTFVWASIVTRGVRFFVVAALLWKFGEPIRAFIEKRLTLVTWLFLIALVGGFVALRYLF